MSETNLLPCPFCGKGAQMITLSCDRDYDDPNDKGVRYAVECKHPIGCMARTMWSMTRKEAKQGWNTRALPPERPEATEGQLHEEASEAFQIWSDQQPQGHRSYGAMTAFMDAYKLARRRASEGAAEVPSSASAKPDSASRQEVERLKGENATLHDQVANMDVLNDLSENIIKQRDSEVAKLREERDSWGKAHQIALALADDYKAQVASLTAEREEMMALFEKPANEQGYENLVQICNHMQEKLRGGDSPSAEGKA